MSQVCVAPNVLSCCNDAAYFPFHYFLYDCFFCVFFVISTNLLRTCSASVAALVSCGFFRAFIAQLVHLFRGGVLFLFFALSNNVCSVSSHSSSILIIFFVPACCFAACRCSSYRFWLSFWNVVLLLFVLAISFWNGVSFRCYTISFCSDCAQFVTLICTFSLIADPVVSATPLGESIGESRVLYASASSIRALYLPIFVSKWLGQRLCISLMSIRNFLLVVFSQFWSVLLQFDSLLSKN